MSALSPDLAETVRAWIAEDPDPATASDLQAALDAAEAGDADVADEIADAFAGRCSSAQPACAASSVRGPTG